MKKYILIWIACFAFLHASGIKGDYSFEKVASNVYTLFGPTDEPNEHNKALSNNPTAIIDESGVIIVDPSGSQIAGEYVLEQLKKVTSKPVIAVINTHIHGDHWLGNQAIIAHYPDVKIYAHPDMLQRMDVEGPIWVDIMMRLTKGQVEGLKVVGPNTKVGHGQIIKVGTQIFKVHNPVTKSHTNTDIMIEHTNTNTLITGDNVFYNRFGMFGEDSEVLGNIEVLHYIKDMKAKIYIPGHGKPEDLTKSYEAYLSYLEMLKEKVKVAFDDGVESYEIKNSIIDDFNAYKSWVGFDDYFGKHIGNIYREIEAKEM